MKIRDFSLRAKFYISFYAVYVFPLFAGVCRLLSGTHPPERAVHAIRTIGKGKKNPASKAGCTNQMPLTIKPYPIKLKIVTTFKKQKTYLHIFYTIFFISVQWLLYTYKVTGFARGRQ